MNKTKFNKIIQSRKVKIIHINGVQIDAEGQQHIFCKIISQKP